MRFVNTSPIFTNANGYTLFSPHPSMNTARIHILSPSCDSQYFGAHFYSFVLCLILHLLAVETRLEAGYLSQGEADSDVRLLSSKMISNLMTTAVHGCPQALMVSEVFIKVESSKLLFAFALWINMD